MAVSKKYTTGNKAVDAEIAYLEKRFPDNASAAKQIKYLAETFGAKTSSGKAERSRTSLRSTKKN